MHPPRNVSYRGNGANERIRGRDDNEASVLVYELVELPGRQRTRGQVGLSNADLSSVEIGCPA